MQDYREMIESFSIERIEEEIEDLKQWHQGNSEMAESARYHRYEKVIIGNSKSYPHLFLADYEDYEDEVSKTEQKLTVCYAVLKEKREKQFRR